MTMPHLMNCAHSENGHCLDCVQAAWDEANVARRDLVTLAERAWELGFAAPYLEGRDADVHALLKGLSRGASVEAKTGRTKISLRPREAWVADQDCMVLRTGYLADWWGVLRGQEVVNNTDEATELDVDYGEPGEVTR